MAKTQTTQTMAEQADALLSMLEDADERELAQIHAGGVKDSKWRRVAEAFLAREVPVQRFTVPTDGSLKIGAVTSGLQNVIARSKDADGNPTIPLKVKSSKLKGVVYLINTELVEETDEPEGDSE